MPYLNIDEVESALILAGKPPNAAFCQLITLPSLTWEGRQCHAIRLGNGSGPGRIGVYFLGGVHAREWGSSDILINFIEQVSKAYRTNSSLSLGGKSFSEEEIHAIINELDIFIFPQANPDGRNFSMTSDAMWRKNRRPAPPGHPNCVGVDVNRNYDFLWNYPVYFNPAAGVMNYTDPCDYQVYIGPAAGSEPETQNVVWIMDSNPSIRFFVDLHSYGEDILYSWGDDENQTADPNMNFLNSAYNGIRGIGEDTAYQEFIKSDDLSLAEALAQSMATAIQAVRGREYTIESSFSLYPTAGTSDDYSFSRHFADTSKGKIIAYTLGGEARQTPLRFILLTLKCRT
jgi:carboxypeptidase T